MKVGIVMPLAEQRGGAELALIHLLKYTRRESSIKYCVAFLEDGPMVAQTSELGVSCRIIEAGRLRQPQRVLGTIGKLVEWIREEKIEVVLSWMTKAHLYAGCASLFAGVSAYWWQWGMPKNDWLDRVATRIPAVGILACSQAGRDAQARMKPLRPIDVVYPAVELNRLAPTLAEGQKTLRRKLGLPEDKIIVGIVARLQRWKGVHHVIDAFRSLSNDFPEAILLIVGGEHSLEPGYQAELRAQAEASGVSQQIIFAGHQLNPQEWMMAMDITINASDNEPFGMVIIEAMALGKPTVAVAASGPAEIITDERNGLLVAEARPDLIAAAFGRILRDEDLRERISQNAITRAHEFGPERFTQRIEAVLARNRATRSAKSERAV